MSSLTALPEERAPGRRQIAVLALGVALTMAAAHATQAWLRGPLIGRPMPWSALFLATLPVWLAGALLTPLVLIWVHRVRIERGRLAGRVLLHLIAAGLFVLVWSTMLAAARMIAGEAPDLAVEVRQLLTSSLVFQFAFYWAIVAAGHAWAWFTEAQVRAVAAAEFRARLSEARLDGLRRQLDPHFLFNALNTVSTLALRGEGDRAAETVGLLSDLLRRSMHEHAAAEIPLEQELGFVEGYLAIQRVRFGDRLAAEWSIAPEVRRAAVPSLLLQPLVENAIVHGVMPGRDPGTIWLRSWREDGVLCLEVEDSGRGFLEAAPDGLALSNLRTRLASLYPGRHRFECTRGAGGGALVRIRIPGRDL
jgi:hypothetical protein